MATATTPTLATSVNPCPNVTVSFTSLPTSASATTITVWRVADGITEQVRNANGTVITGQTTFVVVDYEAPIGIPVVYYASMTIAGVAQGNGPTATTTINDSRFWISDPLNPANSLAIQTGGYGVATLGLHTFETVQRSYKYNRSMVIGQQRPVMQFYGQKGIEGAQFEVYTYGDTDNSMDNLLSVSPILIRVPSVMVNMPARLYGVMEATLQPQTWRIEASSPLNLWTITFNETAPQSLAVVFSVYSYAYWSTKYPGTYATVTASVYGSNNYNYALLNQP